MSAGTGILHSEKNDSWRLTGDAAHDDDVHFVQMWVVPDTASITPGYEQLDINDALAAGGLVPVASGMSQHDSAIRIQQQHAALFAARLAAGGAVALPDAPFVHVYVAKGAIELEGAGRLSTGDSGRITSSQGQTLTAVDGPAEVLVWEMHAQLR
jgi:redox-sensitive bicupin YhaK (pirin superfamily)